MQPFDWNLMKSFLAVVETGSLAAAARRSGLSQPTLGRHIDELERALGAMLFERGRTGMVPTETAFSIAEPARLMQAAQAQVSLTAAGQARTARGTVRITASDVVATFILPPILADLLTELPGIEIELAPANELANLLQRDADIAIRMVRPVQNDLIARKVNDFPMGAFARKEYLARYGTPGTLEELRQHIVIGYDRSDLVIRGFERAGFKVGRDFFRFRCDDQVAGWRAVCDGAGIGFGPKFLGAREPGLVQILMQYRLDSLPMWLVSHRELRTSARIRKVSEFIGQRLAALDLGG